MPGRDQGLRCLVGEDIWPEDDLVRRTTVAGRQRADIERYIKDLLLVADGHQADPAQSLAVARASSDLSPQARANFLENELRLMDSLEPQFNVIAEEQSKRLVSAHERFSALMDRQRFQVVYPVLPMDLLGTYVLLPEQSN